MSDKGVMSNKIVQRRSRILAIQKKTLVQLVRNYFIHYFGSHVNANFNVICHAYWEKFASILNKMGPPKKANQWKNSFSCMTTRIRNKVILIHQSDANPSDNLSKDDLQIYEMMSTVDLESLSNALFQDNEVQSSIATGTKSSGAPLDVEESNEESQNAGEYTYNLFPTFEDFEYDNATQTLLAAGRDVTAENIEHDNAMHMSLSAGRKDSEAPFDVDRYSTYENTEGTEQTQTNIRTVVFQNEDEMEMYVDETIILEDDFSEDLDDVVHWDTTSSHVDNIAKAVTSQQKLPVNVDQSSRKTVEPVEIPKTSARIPDTQKERLVQLIQNNFLKAVGGFAGPNGVAIKTQLWGKIAKELNQLGPARTVEQWKTTFNAIKASAKAKLADNHNGVPAKSLNRLEEKIVAIYGLDSLDGDQRLGEAGFNYNKSVPASRHANYPRNNSTASEERNHNTFNRTKNSQVNSTATSGAYDELAGLNYGFGRTSEYPRPASSEEDAVLQEILSEIRQNDNEQQETEGDAQSSSSAIKTGRNASLKKGMTSTAGQSRIQSKGVITPRLINGSGSAVTNPSNSSTLESRSLTRPNISAIPRMLHYDNVRGRVSGRTERARDSTVDRVDEEPSNVLVPKRDRSNLRNRYTSYDMVQRSIQQQEFFIDEHGRNHADMMYATDRNHTEMIGVFTATLKAFTEVGKEILKK